MNNSMFLRRRNKIYFPRRAKTSRTMPGYESVMVLMTALKNMESLGFTLSPRLLNALQWYSVDGIAKFTDGLIKDMKALVGADVVYKPMYPNFPKQVMEASEAELFINAMMHYLGDWVGLRIMPDYEKLARNPLPKKEMKLTVIDLGDEHEFMTIFTNLLSTKTSLSEQDYEDITYFIKTYKNTILDYMPDKIVHKETLSFVTNLLLKNVTDVHRLFLVIKNSFSTATDILRLAVAMSEGDVSLAQNTKFRNFNRTERRFFLSLFDVLKNYADDVSKRREMFIRLGEKLHPGDYSGQYPEAARIFFETFNDKLPSTFSAQIEKLMSTGSLSTENVYKIVSMLKQRPGDFARRLDAVLRRNKYEHAHVLTAFAHVANNVSTPVLLQLKNHFEHRSKRLPSVIMPKGKIAKAKLLPFDKKDLPKSVCSQVSEIIYYVLIDRFSQLNSLGKVYLDENLRGYNVPFSQRSASRAMKTIVRGSRIPIDTEKGTIRFFIYWKDIKHARVDIDLSAAFLDKNFAYHSHVSYTNLRNGLACHSGDITSAPKGAAEFIDIDIEKALEYGARYVMMNVYSFTGQAYSEMPICYAGWMSRDNVNSGEIFEPSTVENKVDVTTDTRHVMPLVIDLKTREVIWLDLAGTTAAGGWSSTVESTMSGIQAVAYGMVHMKKPNLYDLFQMHAVGRASEIVVSKDAADVIFSVDEGITPFSFDEIIGNYLV